MLQTRVLLSIMSLLMGEFDRAEDELARTIALAGERGNRYAAGLALDLLGGSAWACGEITQARDYYARYIRTMGALGDTQSDASACYVLGLLAEEDGDLAGARTSYAQALTMVREVGDFALVERGAAIAIMAMAARQSVPTRALAYATAAFGLPEAGGKALTLEQALGTAVRGVDIAHGDCG